MSEPRNTELYTEFIKQSEAHHGGLQGALVLACECVEELEAKAQFLTAADEAHYKQMSEEIDRLHRRITALSNGGVTMAKQIIILLEALGFYTVMGKDEGEQAKKAIEQVTELAKEVR